MLRQRQWQSRVAGSLTHLHPQAKVDSAGPYMPPQGRWVNHKSNSRIWNPGGQAPSPASLSSSEKCPFLPEHHDKVTNNSIPLDTSFRNKTTRTTFT